MRVPIFRGCRHECWTASTCPYRDCAMPLSLVSFESENRRLTDTEMEEYIAGGERRKAVFEKIRNETKETEAKIAAIMQYAGSREAELSRRRMMDQAVRNERYRNGLCTVCGIRALRPGKKSCEYCAAKNRERSRKKKEKKDDRQESD